MASCVSLIKLSSFLIRGFLNGGVSRHKEQHQTTRVPYQVQVFLSYQGVEGELNVVVPVQTLARDRVAAETTHGANIATLLNITSVERGMVCQKGTFELCSRMVYM